MFEFTVTVYSYYVTKWQQVLYVSKIIFKLYKDYVANCLNVMYTSQERFVEKDARHHICGVYGILRIVDAQITRLWCFVVFCQSAHSLFFFFVTQIHALNDRKWLQRCMTCYHHFLLSKVCRHTSKSCHTQRYVQEQKINVLTKYSKKIAIFVFWEILWTHRSFLLHPTARFLCSIISAHYIIWEPFSICKQTNHIFTKINPSNNFMISAMTMSTHVSKYVFYIVHRSIYRLNIFMKRIQGLNKEPETDDRYREKAELKRIKADIKWESKYGTEVNTWETMVSLYLAIDIGKLSV